ncbi:chromosome segregation protein SMC [Methylobacillus flagellatus]|uniref:chromosome segregation protein SMC n=1 Tax=Methylobacillus flagellatus TaxID=405 RepID=UPI002853DB0A|nr:chromosome segregation protein SMC [Methylobacillus flagellatus]MDR5171364.1 chromosome segregation protein SMC [Methylobacillus flagellatus]
MRLTHLKLAGFKSFVDPTTLHIHGQRVGVVGPNGCGKSNVMESIRWVLGESSAKEMRSESMADVIFNGSGNRKLASRASVELIFDNSLGGAAGEWSQYAEISVKRVIEREKGSSYFINNAAVRRRDVADLFLGTGLGGRAYAIIGQNTISRIVEARPEEMRVFLEEAAGISKYKERRRETENRLRDTRDNLVRVEDIRQEMDKQIMRLEAQAAVTLQYQGLQNSLQLAQGQLWLLKKRDAGNQWEKSQAAMNRLGIELEAQMAALRQAEGGLEALRQQHQAASAQLQAAQAAYYEANAEVSNQEQQLRHTQEARARLQAQLQQIESQSHKLDQQHQEFSEKLQTLQGQQRVASAEEVVAGEHLQAFKQKLPEMERAFQSALHIYSAAQRALHEAEQAIRLEDASLKHAERNLKDAKLRLQRMQQEAGKLKMPDEAKLHELEAEFTQAASQQAGLEQDLHQLREHEQQQAEQVKALREQLLQHERRLAQAEAEAASLRKIQAGLGKQGQLEGWLRARGLHDGERLWQKIRITPGWETAVEAVLGARLNTILGMPEQDMARVVAERPPAAVVLALPGDQASAAADAQQLSAMVEVHEPGLQGLLANWLGNVLVAQTADEAGKLRLSLENGQSVVTAAGDIYDRHSISLHAQNSELHGVLERQRELDMLEAGLPQMQQVLHEAKHALQQAELKQQELRQQQQQLQQQLRGTTQAQHQRSLQIQQLSQERQHIAQRRQGLENDIAALTSQHDQLQQDRQQQQQKLGQLQASLGQLQSERQETQARRHAAENELNAVRVAWQKAERAAQEKTFNHKLLATSIADSQSRLNAIQEEQQSLVIRRQEAQALLEAAAMENLKANLEAAIVRKQQHEAALAAARDALAEADNALQQQERSRMQYEQALHPLRDKLEQSRLNEQQARLHFEQCQQNLQECGLEEGALVQGLTVNTKTSDLERRIAALGGEIEGLGPVNLAALQELESERERKQYLDSQSADLEQAVATLEDAIRRIDRETRSRLQHTYDEANRNFAELFAELFGGGQAKLEMLGDEILDTGMQVFAQPPGKKNSTIHLLSGGEKALTALALVFALFRLNPAPFCLMDEVDAPLDDSNTERFCALVKKMSERTQFLFVSHNKITMEMAQQLIGVTMQESGVSRIVEVDIAAALQMHEAA